METNLLKEDVNKESNSVTNGIRLLELPSCPNGDRKPELSRDVSNLSIDQSGFQGLLPSCMRVTFADRDAEALYQIYYHKERRRDLQCFLAVAVLFAIFAIIVQCFQPSEYLVAKMVVLTVVGLLNLLVLILCRFQLMPSAVWTVLPYLVWLFYYFEVICDSLLNPVSSKTGDSLPWFLLGTFMADVFLPLRLQFCVLLNIVTLAGHVIIALLTTNSREPVALEITANVLLLLGANVLGCLAYFFADKRHRKAFLEARQTLDVKMVIEEQSQEQERLLLSVLPQHVAQEIRSDLGAVVEGQFKKIYMSRHENVSILFADIVGFTAISSTYTAAELVPILNELFALFDTLSEKYHQLRIKILGDCYYCISGAPEERRDHAVLCVHMGLSMVDAIKYVREKTKSPVDMRVGIHTGGVLAGVLGQRQWQFDVYSKDVELANKMESGGLPGRVHISEKTLRYLDGEFEVEPGDGASREESIKLAGLRTYFIVKVLKPYPEGTLDEKEVQSSKPSTKKDGTVTGDEAKEDTYMLTMDKASNEEEYRRQLYQELVGLGERSILTRTANPLTLCFRQNVLEGDYQSHNGDESGMSIIAAPIVFVVSTCVQFCILPIHVPALITCLLGIFVLVPMTIVSVSPSASSEHTQRSTFPRFIVRFGQSINNDFFKRHLWATAAMLILALTNELDMFFCDDPIITWFNQTVVVDPSDKCFYPQYFTDFAVLVVVAVTILMHITHLVKLVVMLATAVIHCYLNISQLDIAFDNSDTLIYGPNADIVPRKYVLSGAISTITAALAFINHHTEVTARQVFLWRQEFEEQKERANQMRQKNEMLVCNILPPTVAHHFLGSRKKDNDLLSQGFPQVGVLFASMPNFSDFYTEESVNNQGLECLRFLNEVISDFDALLAESRFHGIIKIKTIGSTYMAASGLTDDKHSPDSPIKVQWAHLAQLVEFALALRETLHGINEQSFNNFILRMGINHGPIIAGVIGARKPHYDMWGNTVNVASRMESTGKAGCIQVVEETANILREFDYEFEERGLVSVKGKGKLKTYYLIGKRRGSGTTTKTVEINDQHYTPPTVQQ